MENQHPYQNSIEKLHQDHHHQSTQCKSPPPAPPPSTTASPPSSSSSPAHEFSFTISLHHHHHQPPFSTTAKPPPTSTALDLSPADDIFFHGHLLPLHFLSHLPPSSSSPRSSTNSLDNFTLPINQNHVVQKKINQNHQIPTSTSTNPDPIRQETRHKPKPRPKSFSLFGIPIRRKGDYCDETEEREKQRKKMKFDLSQVVKRYMRMVRPLFNKRRSDSDVQLRRQPYSFSGYLSPRDYYYEEEETMRRGKFSAPASMKTSPSNSGLLVSPSTSDSTMEELQAAIQAAIAHCKNSIAVEEKINKC